MFITTKKLYRNTKNFLFYKFFSIFFISLLTACITMLINQMLIFDISLEKISIFFNQIHYTNNINIILEKFYTLNFEEKKNLLYLIMIGMLSFLTGNVIILIYITLLIKNIEKKFNILNSISQFILLFPNLFLLNFLITIIIQIGFLFLIVPGIIFIIFFSLSPIILIMHRNNILLSIYNSIYIVSKNIKLITPIITFWFFSKLLLIFSILFSSIFPIYIRTIFYNTINNFLFSILIIYLTRLYILLNK